MTRPTLSIVCCGKFHYDRYVVPLERQIELTALYYSYKRGHRIDVRYCRLINLSIKEYLLGLHIRVFGRWALTRAMSIYHWIWRVGLEQVFRPTDINLFLMHGNCLPAMEAAKRSGCLVVCEAVNSHPDHLHELLTNERQALGLPPREVVMNRRQILKELDLADFLLCPSACVAQSYVERGFDLERILICPYGVPHMRTTAQRSPRELPSQRPSILVVAQLDVRKGIHRLLQAIRGSELHAMIDVTVIGAGEAGYAALLATRHPEVTFVRHVPNEKMIEYMQRFSMTCLPSLEDGFGLVALESMAAGVPALVSKYAGAAEYVERFGGGVVFDPLVSSSTLDAVKAVLNGEFVSLRGIPPTWNEYALSLAEKLKNAYKLRGLDQCE